MSIITDEDRAQRAERQQQEKERQQQEQEEMQKKLDEIIETHRPKLEDLARRAKEELYEGLIKELRSEWVRSSDTTPWEKLEVKQHFPTEGDRQLLDRMNQRCTFPMQDAFIEAASEFLAQPVDGVIFGIVRAHYFVACDQTEWTWCVQAMLSTEP